MLGRKALAIGDREKLSLDFRLEDHIGQFWTWLKWPRCSRIVCALFSLVWTIFGFVMFCSYAGKDKNAFKQLHEFWCYLMGMSQLEWWIMAKSSDNHNSSLLLFNLSNKSNRGGHFEVGLKQLIWWYFIGIQIFWWDWLIYPTMKYIYESECCI